MAALANAPTTTPAMSTTRAIAAPARRARDEQRERHGAERAGERRRAERAAPGACSATAITAPTAAPPDTPSRYGSASALRVRALQRGAGGAEPRAHERGEQHARQPQLAHDGDRHRSAGAQQAVQHVGRREAQRAEHDAGDQRRRASASTSSTQRDERHVERRVGMQQARERHARSRPRAADGPFTIVVSNDEHAALAHGAQRAPARVARASRARAVGAGEDHVGIAAQQVLEASPRATARAASRRRCAPPAISSSSFRKLPAADGEQRDSPRGARRRVGRGSAARRARTRSRACVRTESTTIRAAAVSPVRRPSASVTRAKSAMRSTRYDTVGDAGGAQAARGVAVVLARVEDHEVGARGEHRLDVRPQPGSEVGHRARRVGRQSRRSCARRADPPRRWRRAARWWSGLSETMRRGARGRRRSCRRSRRRRRRAAAALALTRGDAARSADERAAAERARDARRDEDDRGDEPRRAPSRVEECPIRTRTGESAGRVSSPALPRGPVNVARTESSPGSGPRRSPSRPQSVACVRAARTTARYSGGAAPALHRLPCPRSRRIVAGIYARAAPGGKRGARAAP